jgi:hypothetical protein
MKIFLIISSLLFSSLVFSAENQDVRVLEIKKEIISMAKSFEGKPDVDGKLQSALEEKVEQLEKIIPYSTMEEKASKIVGAWRQVFGPYSKKADGKIPSSSVTDHIYQVILPNGYFYNVALAEGLGLKAVILLKGKYVVDAESIKATFVRNSLLFKNLPSDESYYLLPEKLEKNEIKVIDLPKSIPPVGTTGELLEVYADSEIRILRGKSPTFKKVALLIMEKKQ